MRFPPPILAQLLATFAFLAPAMAQDAESPPAIQDPIPSIQDIEEKINAVQDSEDLTEDQKIEALAALNDALTLVPDGDRAKVAAESFAAQNETRPEDLNRVREDLAAPPGVFAPDPDPATSLEELDQNATAARNAANAAAEALAAVNQVVRDRPARRAALPQLIAEAQAELEALPPGQADPDPAEPPQLTDARRTFLTVQRYELTQRLVSLGNELTRLEGGGELLTARRDLAAR